MDALFASHDSLTPVTQMESPGKVNESPGYHRPDNTASSSDPRTETDTAPNSSCIVDDSGKAKDMVTPTNQGENVTT